MAIWLLLLLEEVVEILDELETELEHRVLLVAMKVVPHKELLEFLGPKEQGN